MNKQRCIAGKVVVNDFFYRSLQLNFRLRFIVKDDPRMVYRRNVSLSVIIEQRIFVWKVVSSWQVQKLSV